MSAAAHTSVPRTPGAAALAPVADLLEPGVELLFCGINPGLTSSATGHHFARPGNRFWKALAGSGLTPRELSPSEQAVLLELRIGITNLVARPSRAAHDLVREELVEGVAALRGRVEALRPLVVCVLGLGAWRQAVDRRAPLGRQPGDLAGAALFVLPNPSGLQARYQLPDLVASFAEVRAALEAARGARPNNASAGR